MLRLLLRHAVSYCLFAADALRQSADAATTLMPLLCAVDAAILRCRLLLITPLMLLCYDMLP